MVYDMEERMFYHFQDNETLALAAMVDPRIKCCAFADPSAAEKAVSLLKREVQKIRGSNESSSTLTEVVIEDDGIYTTLAKTAAESKLVSSDDIDSEVSLYLKQSTLNHREDPLKWYYYLYCYHFPFSMVEELSRLLDSHVSSNRILFNFKAVPEFLQVSADCATG